MSLMPRVEKALALWPRPEESGGVIRVPTSCLYPSNSIVTVFVEAKLDDLIVHDDGRALDELAASDLAFGHPIKALSQLVRKAGLSVTASGAIVSKRLKIEEVAGAIAIVANASRDGASYLIDHARVPRVNFREGVERELDKRFPKLWKRNRRTPGESTKVHRFDYGVELPGGRLLLVDAVVPDSSSINAAVVANLDVAHARSLKIESRIVYDDREKWKASDLSILRVGARTVPFSSFAQTLDAVAA